MPPFSRPGALAPHPSASASPGPDPDVRLWPVIDVEEVRKGVKTYTNWATYPQLYANGNLIGGLEVVKELVEEEKLLEEIEQSC